MAASTTQPKLTVAHGPGARACIVWDVPGKAILTAGVDTRLLIHTLGSEEPAAASVRHQNAITALCLAPTGHLIASASLDRSVKLYSYPGAKFEGNITRFTLPVRSLAFSSTGGLLAAAGDDDEIKLISTANNSIVRVLKGHQAPVVSLAFDPKNDFLASVDTDGTVIYWALESGNKLHILKHVAPDVDVNEAGRNEIAWHPSGDVLAVPGHQFDVVMYDRDTAEVRFRLRGGHNTAVGFLAWSPNGKYLATAAQDRKVMVWDSESKQDLGRLKVPSQVTALSWKPTGNALALIDVDGKFGVWENAIPSHLPSPSDLQQALAALSRQELLRFSDDDDDDEGNSGSEEEEVEEVEEGEEDSKSEGEEGFSSEGEGDLGRVKKEEVRKVGKGSTELRRNEVSELGESPSSPSRAKSGAGKREVRRHEPCAHKPRPEKQAAFQPGATQKTPGVRRFLAYNLLGCITSFEADGVSHVEVEFHDSGRGHRMPAMTDFNGFTMAALSDRGSIFANPRTGDKTPSTLAYRPCSSLASNSEWSMRFPLTEEVRAVAVGDQWAAAATSLNYLRIFSETGLQKYVLSLAGPVVAMTSHQQLLAIITHASDPLENGEQVMEFVVLNVCNNEQVLSGPLPLTPGAKLMWLGFSESGTLSSYDSKAVLRIFSSGFGGCWIPVLSGTTENESSETFWVVGLDTTQVYCVKCKAPEIQPQVNPKPILSMVNLSMPLAHSDLGAVDLENELLCRSILLFETRARADDSAARGQVDDNDEDQVLKTEAELDRCLLRLMAAACQGDKLARALELATMLSLHKSLEGAIKIVTAMNLPSLADRLNNMLEVRRNSEMSSSAALKSKGQTEMRHRSIPLQSPGLRLPTSSRDPPAANNSPLPLSPTTCPEVDSFCEPLIVQPASSRSPMSLERPQPMTGALSIGKDSEKSTQNSKSIQNPPIKQVSFREVDSSTLLPKSAPNMPDSLPPSKSTNPFAKPVNPFQQKQDKITCDGEDSLLDSLQKMQNSSANINVKRKVNSVPRPQQRPSKVAKAS